MTRESNVKRNLWMYPLGTLGRDIIYQLFNSFILTYILITRNLTAAQLGVITAVMIAARVFDAVNDPIMGVIIEKTRSRFGKFKPWLAIGMVSTTAVIITIFNTKLEGWGFIALFAVIYFLYSITYTMHDISYWGMIPSLSSDANTRNQFTSRATLFAGVGAALAGMLIPMLTVGENAIGGSAQNAFGIVSIVSCVIGLIFICFTIFGVVEEKAKTDINVEHKQKKFKEIVKVIIKNKPLLWIIVAFLIQQIGNGLVAGGLGSTYIYLEYGYSGGKYSLFNTIGLAATAVLMVIFPMISRKSTRKSLMKIMLLVSIIGSVLMLLTGFVLTGTEIGFWILTLGYMMSNLGQYGFYLIMMISILNTVEYNEYISGERDDAVVASVRPFITKLASALIIGITSLSYVVFGVLKYTNGISELERDCTKGLIDEATKNQEIANLISTVDGGAKLGLLLAMVIIPCVLLVISHFIYQKKYTLDEVEYDRICKELEERKAGNAKEE